MQATHGLLRYPGYASDWLAYSRMPGAQTLRFRDAYPQLHDRTAATPFDSHYFYTNGWAMRRIVANHPRCHVDVGSHHMFVNLLGAVLPVVFVDYRPLAVSIDGVRPVGGSLLELPFADRAVPSLSCLHAAEHVGLGRYGDPLDPLGSRKAAHELARVLAAPGDLFFAVPIGRPRVCFNAHRVHRPGEILELFPELELAAFSAVADNGAFLERAQPRDFAYSSYACGLFWFRKTP